MAKFRIELDGPTTAVIVQDGDVLFNLSQFGLVLDAPSGQNFVTITKTVPGGTFNTCLDITKATLLIETTEEEGISA